MLELLDAENLLEHFIELILAEDEFGSGTGRHALLGFARVFIATVDGVELGHPGAEHRLLTQPVDLWQAAHSLFNVPLEHFTTVQCREATGLDHLGHTITLKEDL